MFIDNRTPLEGKFYQGIVNDTAKTILELCGLTKFPANSNACLVQVDEVNDLSSEALAVRYREDNTPPTNSVGFCFGIGDFRELSNISQMKNIRFVIAETGKTALLNIQFYKES